MMKHSNTKKMVRRNLMNWKRSVKASQKQCYITGSTENLEIHHAGKSFSEIFHEAHEVLGLEYHTESKCYSKADLQALVDLVVDQHKDVTPVVLTEHIHHALHDIYGEHVNMDQINEFKAQYIKNKTMKGGK